MKYLDLNKKSYRRRARKRVLSGKRFFSLALLVLVFGLAFVGRRHLKLSSLLTPVSVFSQMVRPTGSLKSNDGRTNILLLGVDRRSNSGYISGTLTDTIMLASVDFKSKDVALISIPRDLWVKMDQFGSGKINAAYATGGVELARKIVSRVLGVPVHYFVVVDFQSFEKAVDLVGGIEVEVERAFDDYKFPKPGFENAEPEELRWEHWRFDAGRQQMDGRTALVFARSRHAKGPEGSDFARIKRQQKVIEAFRRKLLSLAILANPAKLRELYDLFADSVETDFGWEDLQAAATVVRNPEEYQTRSYLIDGSWGSENALLYTPEAVAYNGSYVLIPRAGDYSEIHYFVQKTLFGNNELQ